jgi:hypothetical protein
MRSHPFDPVSALLALIALVVGTLVIAGSTLPFEANVGPWLAAIALAFGVSLLPWSLNRGRALSVPDGEADDGPARSTSE